MSTKKMNLMELSSTINSSWKLCLTGSLFGCIFLIFFLNQNDHNLSLFTARNTVQVFDEAEAPMSSSWSSWSTMISDPPKPSTIISLYNPPILASSLINEIPKPGNFSSTPIEQPKSTHTENLNIPFERSEKAINNTSDPKKCNMFDGRWVYKPDENPYYDSNTCPFVEEKMSCRKNGRPDFEYERWRWEANHCDIPLFNGRDMLERLRNKRVIIVGDSLNRNMWESLSCLLYSSVPSSRVEVEAKGSQYKVLKAKDYNTIVEFHWSPFLVEFDVNHKTGKNVLLLDKLSPNAKLWRGADVMVFNSAHWWTHKGKYKKWDFIKYKGQLLEEMPVEVAYERGMKTWAKWVEKNVDSTKTKVFFRSVSAQHNGRRGCYNVTWPIIIDEDHQGYINHFPKQLITKIENVINGINKVKVNYLNITKLSEYRIDAHPSLYRSSWKWKLYTTKYKRLIPSYADCSHWCLPGLPDTWNRLLYASLFFDTSRNTSTF
ncbi:protein trichome birefringence-like 36 [Spinacia oleracea]|uniref:Protein trichome birefringence-like 36 n=1 Tax=Spinacia oleracea TaxID=3562 RepID=A0A9R0JQ69_SPIOL|nr:protein trichome birefringence-like 36 [Spinacia oleracea]